MNWLFGLVCGSVILASPGFAQPCDSPVPRPSRCVAEVSGCNEVLVSWGYPGGADGMFVYRNGEMIASLPGDAVEYTDIAPLSDPETAYRVVAECGDDVSLPSRFGYAGRLGLAPPSDVTATEPNCGGYITVDWTYDRNAPDAFELVRRVGDGAFQVVRSVGGRGRNVIYREDGGDPIELAIRAVSECGEETSEAIVVLNEQPTLASPTSVLATDRHCIGSVVVTWEYTDETDRPEEFEIYRDGTLLGNVGYHETREFVDTTAEPEQEYEYTVAAFRVGCERAISEADVGSWVDVSSPEPPENLTAMSCREVVRLSWAERSDALSYMVYRDGNPLGTVASPSFVDESPDAGAEHEYSVSIDSACGVSPPSAVVAGGATGVDVSLPAPTGLSPEDGYCPGFYDDTLSWDPVSGAASYRVGFGPSCDGAVVEATAETQLEVDVPVGASYWWVEAVDACGVVGERSACHLIDRLSTPSPMGPFTMAAHPDLPERYVLDWDDVPGDTFYRFVINDGCSIRRDTVGSVVAEVSPFVLDLRPFLPDGRAIEGLSANCSGTEQQFGIECIRFDCDPIQPFVPTHIAASRDCSNRIELSWTFVGDGGDVDVYRDGTLHDTVVGDTYTDFYVAPSEEHSYTLVVRNRCAGVSDESSPVIGTTTADDGDPFPAPILVSPVDGEPCPNPTGDPVFDWDPVAGASAYVLTLGTNDCEETIHEFVVEDETMIRVLDDIEPGTYTWSVRSVGTCGSRSLASECRTVVLPGPPPAPSLSFVFGSESVGHVTVSWEPVEWAVTYDVRVFARFPTGTSLEIGSETTSETSAAFNVTPWLQQEISAEVVGLNCRGEEGISSGRVPIEFPTPVLLEHFRAVASPAAVSVEWRTAVVSGMLGFHVDRALAGSASFDRLTTTSIPLSDEGTYAFVDRDVTPGLTYDYRLYELLSEGGVQLLGEVRTQAAAVPVALSLAASPNPFNPRTTFTIALPSPSRVTLDIFDLAGRRVVHLIESELPIGFHRIEWSGRSSSGAVLSSGTYFARVRSAHGTKQERIVLLK